MERMTTTVVVALIGLPGAGKSCIADALATRLGLHRICRDRIRAAMFPHCAHTPAEKRAAFRALLLALEVNCALGRSSVIDGMTFSRRADLDALAAVLRGYPQLALPMLVDCPPELARARIAADPAPHPAGDRSPALVDQVQARFDAPPAGVAVVDARLPRAAMVAAAVAHVAARMGVVDADPGAH
jgi:predicted kinase